METTFVVVDIGLPDMLIAGICLAHEVPLVTRNQVHFARVPGLSLVDPATFNF